MDPEAFRLVRPVDRSDPFLWLSLFAILGATYLLARVATWFAIYVSLRPVRKLGPCHWTDKARASWPARRLGASAFVVVAGPPAVIVARDFTGTELLPRVVALYLVVMASLLGVLSSRFSAERRINPAVALTARPALGFWGSSLSVSGFNVLITFLLFGLVAATKGTMTWVVVAVGMIAPGAYYFWGWPRLLRLLRVLKPASTRLETIVARISESSRVSPRLLCVAGLPNANALVIPAGGLLAVTDAAMSVLDDDELAAACAHEFAHLHEPIWARASRFIFVLVYNAWVALPAAFFAVIRELDPDPRIYAFMAGAVALSVILVSHLFIALSRRMESRADSAGTEAQFTPGTFARAIEKLYATNMIPATTGSKRQTHPDLYDRLIDAGAHPDYARPLPPASGPFLAGLIALVAATAVGAAALNWLGSALAGP